ncbi:restriction endonuclease subunit S [Halomonas piscis]|uniref:restriction endonuclease subunit S n=1 Tax=Halomonas piscis TaxID=3031727 RepID=UPI0028977A5D|nr:restriction endonuclease subunit S [Halomonas piscis]
MSAQKIITDHLDLWTGAVTHKSSRGRGANGKIELTGIKKLRELILELAVRGKLVEQDSNDEPASVLLERIAEEKARLVKEGKTKKPKKLPEITEEEEPFELPVGWTWARLGNISQINPRNIADDKIIASFIPMPLITTSFHGEHEQETRSWGEIKKGYTHFADGDIAIAKITPCFENSKAAVFRNLESGIGAGTTELHVARPYEGTLNQLFILLCLKSPRFLINGESKMTGSAGQKRVPKDFFAGEPLPFPPLAEQNRIVEKVDELMALCDRLEQQVGDQLEAHEVLVDTLLDALTRSADASEVAENWARIAEHFDTLFNTEASIDKLKQTILQLAVMGRLVEQDPNDEPASELLERIAEEKALLVKEGKIKKPKKLPEIADNEEPFPISNKWRWVRFGEITFNRDSERIPLSVNERSRRKGEYDYYGASGVIDKIDEFLFEKPLLLIGEDGANLINRSTPIAFIARGKYWVNNHAHVIDGISEDFLKYLSLYINAISLEPYVTGTAQPKMNQAKMNSIIVGLPPMQEQQRLIEKYDAFMALCDQLKARLNETGETRVQLAGAVVEQAVG